MRTLFTILILLSWLKSNAQDLDKTFTLDGFHRHCIIHLPTGYSAQSKLPVIFALHGGGGTAKYTVGQYNLNPLADKYHYIVVYPDAVNKSWSMPGISSKVKGSSEDINDVKFISTLMDTLVASYKADDKRFFCTGLSRGGIFSLYLAYKLSARIKAIAPVCASIPESIAADYHFDHPTPVMLIDGTNDPLILYNGGKGKFSPAYGSADEYAMISADNLIKKLLESDHITTQPQIIPIPDSDPSDGCTATISLYQGAGTIVKFIKITGGGHTWPGGAQYLPRFLIGRVCLDFKAEEMVFDFFNATQ